MIELDKSWALEDLFLEEAAVDLKAEQVPFIACRTIRSIGATSSAKLIRLSETDSVKFASRILFRRFGSVIEILASMEQGLSPNVDIGDEDVFFKEVLDRLALFTRNGQRSAFL